QRPSVRMCAGSEGWSAPSLYCWSVCGALANFRTIYPTFGSTTKLQHILAISRCLLRQVLQQLLHSFDKRRELIWILLRKRFINLQGLFKCLSRLLWSVLGTLQNSQIVECCGDVRQISFRLFVRQITVNF